MDKVYSRSYTLRSKEGYWLGQVVLTSDGMFSAVTDYGNFGYAWRSYGNDFKAFILKLNTGYFADKMVTGMAYVAHSKNIEKAAARFAEKILPPLQCILNEEIENGIGWID